MALLGQIAGDRQAAAEAAAKKQNDTPPPVTVEAQLNALKDDLKSFADAQKRIIDATRQFKELNPEDLTTDQQAVLGELGARGGEAGDFFPGEADGLEQAAAAGFRGRQAGERHERGVPGGAEGGDRRCTRSGRKIAVAGETAGLEKAEQIEQNLERWLPNAPDNTKWSMEEPKQQQDIPMAELPKQLDDLIGDLMKQEQADDPEKDDVSSSIMDSADKGAGWGAGDGPMSNMSAKGVTGNQLPNNDEITGRSGEGRNGKSDGQMVGDTAVGKGGNETPTRMTPTPFENGSVADASKDTKGGATGGGKLAGYGQEGLRGPMPPAQQQRMKMLADQQAKLRQQAESLALQLRKQRRPTGDLESAINAMKTLEDAERNLNGLAAVQGYHSAMDGLQSARDAYSGDRLSRVEADALARDPRKDVNDAQAEDAPAGYEEMTGAYFRSLNGAPADAAPAEGK